MIQNYTTVGSVSAYAAFAGLSDIWQALSDNERKQCVYFASRDIDVYCWGMTPAGNSAISTAANIQSLFIAENFNEFKLSARISSISSGSFDDTNLNISKAAKRALSDEAKILVDEILDSLGIARGISRG